MKTKTHFAFRIDIWDDVGGSIVEHVAGSRASNAVLAVENCTHFSNLSALISASV